MKKFIAAMVASLAFTAHALPKDEDIWTFIASDSSGNDRYSILNKSGVLTTNDDGIPIIVVQGRIVSKGKHTQPLAWYVPLAHCDNGQGVIVITKTTGEYVDKAAFAFGSGSLAGLIAEVMCGGAEKMLKDKTTPPQEPTKKQPKQNNAPGMV
jgi:hypothetical protein